MFSRTEYDREVNTFSPEGRLYQVEYAMEAMKMGSTAVGIQIQHGVVLAAERRMGSTLIIPSSVEKIHKIDSHIFCIVSGLIADSYDIIERARSEALNHEFMYNEKIPVESVAKSISEVASRFGNTLEDDGESDDGKQSRPLGISLLLAGFESYEPSLFYIDPSGSYVRYKAKAIGAGHESAQLKLHDEYSKIDSLEAAQLFSLSLLKDEMEEPITSQNVEIVVISKTGASIINETSIHQILQKIHPT